MRLQMPWWVYLCLSLLDVIPNFMTLISLRYTTLTSTTLLGSLTGPSTMLFSRFILGRRFGKLHYLGVLLCVLGGGLTVWGDYQQDNDDDDEDATRTKITNLHAGVGDLLAVVAALMNGLEDVFAEYCVKNVDPYELLGMLGVFGSIITGLAFPFIEKQALAEIMFHRSAAEQWDIVQVFAWYIASVLLYYVGEAYFLVSSDATLLNLSLQSSNLWAIGFSWLAYHILPPLLFYPALVLVVCGVGVYEWNALDDSHETAAALGGMEAKESQRLLLTDGEEGAYDSICDTEESPA